MPADETTPGTFTIPDTPTRGRGRPKAAPASGKVAEARTTQQTNADVKKALKTLDSGYTLIATGLLLLGLTDTATAWAESTEELNRQNEASLNAAPKLAKRIATLGEGGGSATFFITHGIALVPVVQIARAELAAKAAAKIAEVVNENDGPADPFVG